MKRTVVLLLCIGIVSVSLLGSPSSGWDASYGGKIVLPRRNVESLACWTAIGLAAAAGVGILTPCSIICAVAGWYLLPVVAASCEDREKESS